MTRPTRITAAVLTVALAVPCSTLHANKYGSVEPIANSAVIDTGLLSGQPLEVREAFTQDVLRKLAHGNDKRAIDEVTSFRCR